MMNEIVINNSNGTLTVSSVQVAEDFGKQHKNVIQNIENLIAETSAEISANLFIESAYPDKYGRQQKCYELTRDGFSLLVMGFTGAKALEWKLKYIQAFNEMEQQLREQAKDSYMIEDPVKRAERWIEEQKEKQQLEITVKQQEKTIGKLKPRADYTDTVLKSSGLVTITQIAKDYGMSGASLNKLLHALGVQYKQSGQWLLYAKYHNKRYAQSETINFKHSDGRPDTKMETKWTQKGRLFIYARLKAHGILPVMERGDENDC